MSEERQEIQIATFLSSYAGHVVEAGVRKWREENFGLASDVPLAQNIGQLDTEAKKFVRDEGESVKTPPCPSCDRPLSLVSVCGSCKEGKEGYKSKFTCFCGHEEYFKETWAEKVAELKGV